MGGDGRPNVSTHQPLADRPDLVQDANTAIGLNSTDEMDATRGDWQDVGDELPHLMSQMRTMFGALLLNRGMTLQYRWGVVVHIPLDKLLCPVLDIV